MCMQALELTTELEERILVWPNCIQYICDKDHCREILISTGTKITVKETVDQILLQLSHSNDS